MSVRGNLANIYLQSVRSRTELAWEIQLTGQQQENKANLSNQSSGVQIKGWHLKSNFLIHVFMAFVFFPYSQTELVVRGSCHAVFRIIVLPQVWTFTFFIGKCQNSPS